MKNVWKILTILIVRKNFGVSHANLPKYGFSFIYVQITVGFKQQTYCLAKFSWLLHIDPNYSPNICSN